METELAFREKRIRNGQTAPEEVISQLKLRDKKQLAKLERVGSVSERRNRRRVQRQKNVTPSRNHEGFA